MTTRTLGQRLTEAMEDADVNDEQLAKEVSRILQRPADKPVPKQTIQKIRTGGSRQPKLLVEIALALGVRAEWLRTGKGPKRPEGRAPEDELAARLRSLPPTVSAFITDQVMAFSELSRKHPDLIELVFSTPHGNRHQWFMKVLEDAQRKYRQESSRSR